ncbi:phosphonatase-like hydrolase [Paenarthrobacter nitroguajacolicus]|uniref:phosphonatase-like hydrolase n=1 Tax=Paenarthrobacter nitroguajacolicus TaxID=211146 RepID=UPI003AE8C88D
MIKLVCLDMAGTTVQDGGLVKESFITAVTEMGLAAGSPGARDAVQYALDTMGQSKIDVFMEIFDGDPVAAGEANGRFEAAYERNIASTGVAAISGAAHTISSLRQAGLKVVLTTGFSPTTRDRLMTSLGWEGLVEDALSPADAGRGRPAPDMILTAMLRFGIDDVREIAVAGDTTSDLLAGTRSGASVVAGVLTGAHTREDLQTAPHTHILESVTDLPGVLLP